MTDELEVTLAGRDISNVENFRLESNDPLGMFGLNLDNVAFQTVTVDFKGAEQDGGDMTISRVNKGSAVVVKDIDLDGNALEVEYAGPGAINNSLTLSGVENGTVEVDFNHPENEAEEIPNIAGGTYTVNLEGGSSDLYLDLDGEGAAATLNLNVRSKATGIEINNYAGFAKDQNATVNISLDADLSGSNWDLGDLDGTGKLLINVSGAGNLTIDGLDDSLAKTVVSAGSATGNIKIDFIEIVGGEIGPKTDVESVTTGSGDDRIGLDSSYFDDDNEIVVALGGGRNTLAVNSAVLGALDFTAATITNAQILEIVDGYQMSGDEELNMTGVGGVDTLLFSGDFDGEDDVLALRFSEDDDETDEDKSLDSAPVTFTVDFGGETDDVILDSGAITNLTVKAKGELDIEQILSEKTESLKFVSADYVWVDLSSDDKNLSALKSVEVISGEDADLEMVGTEMMIASGTAETFGFEITKGFTGNPGSWSITLDFASGQDLVVTGSGQASEATIAAAIAAALIEQRGFRPQDIVINNIGGNNVELIATYPAVGVRPDLLEILATSTRTNNGNNLATFDYVDGESYVITDGENADPDDENDDGDDLFVGVGFNALEDVKVTAEEGDAYVYIEDAYGRFNLNVSAVNEEADGNADVYVYNANVATVVVSSFNHSYLDMFNVAGLASVTVTSLDDGIDVYVDDVSFLASLAGTVVLSAEDYVYAEFGNVIGMKSLAVVAGDDEEISEIYLAGTIDLTVIDLTGVTDNDSENDDNGYIYVDASSASFGAAVTVRLGAADVEYSANIATVSRETFVFTSDFGTVTIYDFGLSIDSTGDKVDLSSFAGIASTNDLTFTNVTDGVEITAADEQFAGVIYLAGIESIELSAQNFIL